MIDSPLRLALPGALRLCLARSIYVTILPNIGQEVKR